ncbi:hypothetical protein EJ08DRAFT_701131 [Tothia fuscella]|uniref:C2H2-type domain-containing protein n=1 Tax=Tothia fuscella TaxID=1048955 RepID=A0A9P4NIR6_9PEZI|nr:hypothetical protein EJ08DRAFT_701131 [Tothia fuscella]
MADSMKQNAKAKSTPPVSTGFSSGGNPGPSGINAKRNSGFSFGGFQPTFQINGPAFIDDDAAHTRPTELSRPKPAKKAKLANPTLPIESFDTPSTMVAGSALAVPNDVIFAGSSTESPALPQHSPVPEAETQQSGLATSQTDKTFSRNRLTTPMTLRDHILISATGSSSYKHSIDKSSTSSQRVDDPTVSSTSSTPLQPTVEAVDEEEDEILGLEVRNILRNKPRSDITRKLEEQKLIQRKTKVRSLKPPNQRALEKYYLDRKDGQKLAFDQLPPPGQSACWADAHDRGLTSIPPAPWEKVTITMASSDGTNQIVAPHLLPGEVIEYGDKEILEGKRKGIPPWKQPMMKAAMEDVARENSYAEAESDEIEEYEAEQRKKQALDESDLDDAGVESDWDDDDLDSDEDEHYEAADEESADEEVIRDEVSTPRRNVLLEPYAARTVDVTHAPVTSNRIDSVKNGAKDSRKRQTNVKGTSVSSSRPTVHLCLFFGCSKSSADLDELRDHCGGAEHANIEEHRSVSPQPSTKVHQCWRTGCNESFTSFQELRDHRRWDHKKLPLTLPSFAVASVEDNVSNTCNAFCSGSHSSPLPVVAGASLSRKRDRVEEDEDSDDFLFTKTERRPSKKSKIGEDNLVGTHNSLNSHHADETMSKNHERRADRPSSEDRFHSGSATMQNDEYEGFTSLNGHIPPHLRKKHRRNEDMLDDAHEARSDLRSLKVARAARASEMRSLDEWMGNATKALNWKLANAMDSIVTKIEEEEQKAQGEIEVIHEKRKLVDWMLRASQTVTDLLAELKKFDEPDEEFDEDEEEFDRDEGNENDEENEYYGIY